ncbi:hypothetical protein Psi02_52010 [Planotetraspora silvatica]|uniref:Uncharacterized protein n=1 Tax=Planotetraspora silvatica TaxID=234614 RepID=A0A8J3US18_9ACTN|nr:hypothetical protein [Planotetraspora silvatica]GII48777.1 hypothetical protein Psi02_52010 [Planotetraspora silvatica]
MAGAAWRPGGTRPAPRTAVPSRGRTPAKSRARRSVAIAPPYHGIHVAPLQREHERIKWMRDTRRSDRVRVRRHTCDCKETIYELCHAGGLLFIRRTVREPGGPVAHETERLITVRMEDLWMRLILGQAR